jgi:hypothetical protein
MKNNSPKSFATLLLLLNVFFLFACGTKTDAQNVKPFEGKWQGMTYGSGAYDPMFTCIIKPNGIWTDVTFGEARAIKSTYKFDKKTNTITLYTAKGSKLYIFKLEPNSINSKERLVEQLPANEMYRAMICYRKT